jgi:hypothetical protein
VRLWSTSNIEARPGIAPGYTLVWVANKARTNARTNERAEVAHKYHEMGGGPQRAARQSATQEGPHTRTDHLKTDCSRVARRQGALVRRHTEEQDVYWRWPTRTQRRKLSCSKQSSQCLSKRYPQRRSREGPSFTVKKTGIQYGPKALEYLVAKNYQQ